MPDDDHGTCSSRSGWTIDGLHPPWWVLGGYLSASLNVLADYAGCPAVGAGKDEDVEEHVAEAVYR